jgi:WD40 repeat protein
MRHFIAMVATLVSLFAGPRAQAQDRPLPIIETGVPQSISVGVFFLPGDKQALTVGRDRTVRFWDVADGQLLKTLHLPQGPGSEGQPRASALSPDGKLLAVGGLGYTEKGQRTFPVLLIDLAQERVDQRLRGPTTPVVRLSFSGDGKRLAAVGSEKDAVFVWDIGQDTAPRQFFWPKNDNPKRRVRLSPDGKLLLYAGYTKGFKILEVDTGNTRFEYANPKSSVFTVAWSPDGKIIATGHVDGLRLWKPDGTLLRHLGEFRWSPPFLMEQLSFGPDSKKLYFAASNAKKCHALDLATFTAKELAVRAECRFLVASGNGNWLLSETQYNFGRRILSASDGSFIRSFGGTPGLPAGVNGWSKDGNKIAWLHAGKPLPCFDLTKLGFDQVLDDAAVQGPVRDFKGLSLGRNRDKVVKEGMPIAPLPEPILEDVFTFLNTDELVYRNRFGDIILFDIAKKRIVCRVPVHNADLGGDYPGKVFATMNGRYVASYGGPLSDLAIWDPRQNRLLLNLRIFAIPTAKNTEAGWIAWTPEGFYACTPGVEQKFGFLLNQGPDALPKFVPAREYRKSLYRPDVIKLLLECGSVEKALEAADKARGQKTSFQSFQQLRPPSLAVTTSASAVVMSQPGVKVTARITNAGSHPVKSLQLLLDGRPYQGDQSLLAVQGETLLTWDVDLPSGLHRLSVQASTEVGSARSDEIELTYQPPMKVDTRPALYLLAVGINAYPGDWRLHCAVNDARKIADVFAAKGKPIFRDVQTKTLVDAAAGRAGILEGFTWLKQKMTAQDVAVIFYAGHGAKDEQGRFHLLPQDFNAGNLTSSAISGDEMKKRLADLPGRILLLLDACHSGAVGRGKGVLTDELTRDLADDDCGVVVLCAAMGREEAGEEKKLGHGYFALAVIESLSGKGDVSRRDGAVYLHHLEHYVIDRVEELSNDEQHPVSGKPTSVRSFALAKP